MGIILLFYFWLTFFTLVTKIHMWNIPVVTYELTRKDATSTDTQRDEVQSVPSQQLNCFVVYCSPLYYGTNFNQNSGIGYQYGGYAYQAYPNQYYYYYYGKK